MKNDVEMKLKELIIKSSKINVDINQINEDTDLVEDLQFDLLMIIELLTTIEEQLNFVFEEEDLGIEKLVKFGCLKEVALKSIK